ncbi:MAG: DUF4924 family protein [Paludibacter sp.]|jgi:hypothetical protein|nr:DUF4924 family protein [Paludibacter sp.]
MYIAQKLKHENIVEYLLYMWQIEDLLRAFELNMDTVNEKIVKPYPIESETERKKLYEWYESIIEMLKSENAQKLGHIQINKNIIIQINDFHTLLLESGKMPDYNAKFYYILPSINTLHTKNTTPKSDIEVLMNFMYGIMTLQMRKIEIAAETLTIKQEAAKFLHLLAKYYKMYQKGDLEFED